MTRRIALSLVALPLAGLLLCAASVPDAQQHPDLPPPELVVPVLDAHPAVEAAAARLDGARAQAGMLKSGAHEVTVTGSYLRRSVDREGGFDEFDTTVTRPFRLPGKASLDRKAGDLGIEAAHNRMEDVRHQTSLVLAALWYDWLTAANLARTDGQSVANLEKALAAVNRRAELRDAAPLERDQAESALALARGQLADSEALAAQARVTLAANFPDLPLPHEAPALAAPHGSLDDFAALRDLVIARSHEIGAARAEAGRQSVLASRSRAEKTADPSFGFRLFSERGGAEKGVGLVASLPIGGSYRARAADEASAMARSAALELSVVEREVQAMADADLSNARTRLAGWRDMEAAASRAAAVVDRTVKGYELGAIDLADRLYAERQANDARRAEIAARGEALRAILKLEIDAHVLWAPAHDEGAE
jgi:outer membrane protein TolC